MADPTTSSTEVRRLVKRAQEINAERIEKVDELAATRELLRNYATLGEVGDDLTAAVGDLFPRQFPDWAPKPEAAATANA